MRAAHGTRVLHLRLDVVHAIGASQRAEEYNQELQAALVTASPEHAAKLVDWKHVVPLATRVSAVCYDHLKAVTLVSPHRRRQGHAVAEHNRQRDAEPKAGEERERERERERE